jgi:phosphopantothenoylcysteine synthetase/decarboxylase
MMPQGVLYLVVCAAGPAPSALQVVEVAQATGWDVCVILTPRATGFIDIPRFERLTGHPVRNDYKRPEDPDALPKANAVVVFPATFNTINKWALGITDTLALGLLCELTGLRLPIVAVPSLRTGGGLDLHPAFKRSVRMLRRYGVDVFYEPETYSPRNQIPAEAILARLDTLIQQKRTKA